MSSLLTGLTRVNKATLSDSERAQIINNIGCLVGMSESITDTLGAQTHSEQHSSNLAFAASLLAEIIGELNGLLQTPLEIN